MFSSFKFIILYSSSFSVLTINKFSFKTCNSVYGDVIVDFDGEPRIKVGEPFTFKYTIRNTLHESYNADVKIFLPDGWVAEYDHSVYVGKRTRHTDWYSTFTVTVTANENIVTNNKLILSISSPSRALEYAIPINILG